MAYLPADGGDHGGVNIEVAVRHGVLMRQPRDERRVRSAVGAYPTYIYIDTLVDYRRVEMVTAGWRGLGG